MLVIVKIDDVAQRANMTKKDAAATVDAMLGSISHALAEGDKVQLTGFGTFEVRERDERRGRNPQTGAEITIPLRNSAIFRPGKLLKEAVK